MKVDFNPYVVWTEKRVAKNKNCIMVFNGQTGSGKTYSAIDLAVKISKKLGSHFTPDDNIAFSFVDILKKTMLPQNKKPGTCFVLEEVGSIGSGAAASQWQSQANQFFSSFLQTTRHRRQVLLMTTPYFDMLMKQGRSLVHAQFQMERINVTEKAAIAKAYITQVNTRTGKMYFKWLRMSINGHRMALPYIKFRLPPKDILKRYEEMKTDFTSSLNKMIINKSEEETKKQSGEDRDKREIQFDWVKMKLLKDKGLSNSDVGQIFGVSHDTIARRLKDMKNMEKLELQKKKEEEDLKKAEETAKKNNIPIPKSDNRNKMD